jgi:hypothetical protein
MTRRGESPSEAAGHHPGRDVVDVAIDVVTLADARTPLALGRAAQPGRVHSSSPDGQAPVWARPGREAPTTAPVLRSGSPWRGRPLCAE